MKQLFYLLCLSFLLLLSLGCEDECSTSPACQITPSVGPIFCAAVIPAYYYDKDEGVCKSYVSDGCDYAFGTLEECQQCICN